MSTVARLRAQELEQFATNLLLRLGLPQTDASLTARALVQADLEGTETHGLARLPNYVQRLQKGLINPQPSMQFIQRLGATALLDADNGMGQVGAAMAMHEAIQLAETLGIGWVGVRNSNHFGTAAFFCNMALEADMIGFAFSNTPPGVAPYGGREVFLGTNPIGVSIPTGSATPISIDMATSATARGHILKAKRDGTPIPHGWAVDASGAPTSDPSAALAGALLPMAGAKGYGLALAVEVMCGVLTGAHVGREVPSFFDDWERPSNVGHTLGAINIAAFADPMVFQQRTDSLIEGLKHSLPANGYEAVRVPGERRAQTVVERREREIALPTVVIQQLTTVADELGVDLPAAL